MSAAGGARAATAALGLLLSYCVCFTVAFSPIVPSGRAAISSCVSTCSSITSSSSSRVSSRRGLASSHRTPWSRRRRRGRLAVASSVDDDDEDDLDLDGMPTPALATDLVEYVGLDVDEQESGEGVVRSLPIFPLGGGCPCPSAILPLHIFEMRYRQMMNKIGSTDNKFGIVMLNQKQPDEVSAYGTVMEITDKALLDDGRQEILTEGRSRFKILRITQTKPFMVADVLEGVPDDAPFSEDEAALIRDMESKVWQDVEAVMELTNELRGDEAPPVLLHSNVKKSAPTGSQAMKNSLKRTSDFSFAVGEMIALPPGPKQKMHQTRSTLDRLTFQHYCFVGALKYLRDQVQFKKMQDMY